jgi:hypothetical protein
MGKGTVLPKRIATVARPTRELSLPVPSRSGQRRCRNREHAVSKEPQLKKEVPAAGRDFKASQRNSRRLRRATLPILSFVLLFFILSLAALFWLSGLPVLLTGLPMLVFLTMLSGLVARLSALTGLSTLLSVLFHFVCHELVLQFCTARRHSAIEFICCILVAAEPAKVDDERLRSPESRNADGIRFS